MHLMGTLKGGGEVGLDTLGEAGDEEDSSLLFPIVTLAP